MLRARKQAIKALVNEQKAIFKSLQGTTGHCRDWENFMLDLPRRKLSGPSQRAQFVYFLYQYLLEYCEKSGIAIPNNRLDDAKAAKLAVLAELVICCQYYENYRLDGKNGVTTNDLRNKYQKAEEDLKKVIFDYIDEYFTDGFDSEKVVRARVEKDFYFVTVGQKMEVDYNHYDSFEKGLPEIPVMDADVEETIDYDAIKGIQKILLQNNSLKHSEAVFFRTYLKRVNLATTQLFTQFADILIELIGLDRNRNQLIIKFATYFGYFSQLLNDNIDFAEMHTGSKEPEDAYSDLKNKNITYPLFLHLIQKRKDLGRSEIQKILRSKTPRGVVLKLKQGKIFKVFRSDVKKKINLELIPTMLDQSKSRINAVAEAANNFLIFDLKARKLLTDLATIGLKNRFYIQMEEQLNAVREPESTVEKKPSYSPESVMSQIWRPIILCFNAFRIPYFRLATPIPY